MPGVNAILTAIASFETRSLPGRKLNLSAAIFLWNKIDFSMGLWSLRAWI